MKLIKKLLKWSRYSWSAPCTAVGLLFGALSMIFGARMQSVQGTLEIALSREGSAAHRRLGTLPFAAITLGHVIIGLSTAELAQLRHHEQAHVRQYERWGVLFFIAYPACSVWQWLKGKRPYWDNHFEVQARAQASCAATLFKRDCYKNV
jgi:hypothetical protein